MNVNTLNVPGGIVLAVGLAALAVGALALSRDHRDTLRFQVLLLLAAFGIRFAAATVIYGAGLVSVLKDEDSIGWYNSVRFLHHESPRLGSTSPMAVAEGMFSIANRGYMYLLAGVFWLTGIVGRMPAAAVNACAAAVGVVLVYRIVRRLATEQAARRAGYLVAGMPLMVIWSSQTLKEPIVLLMEAAGLYACVRFHEGSVAPRHALLALASLVAVISLRFYVAYVLGVSIIVALVWATWRVSRSAGAVARRAGVAAVVVLLLAVVSLDVARLQFGLEFVQRFRTNVSPTEEVSTEPSGPRRKALYDVRDIRQLPLVLTVGSAYALLAPFPWQFDGASRRFLLTLPDMLIWWVLLALVVAPGVWRALRHRVADVLPLVTFLVMLGGLYSLMFGNVGIAYRQRAQLFPILIALAAAGNAPRSMAGRGHRGLRIAGLALTALLPGPVKRLVYRWAFGYRIERGARIGVVLLDCRSLTMASGAVVRHGTVFLRCGDVTIGEHASIGLLNLFRGGDRIAIGAYSTVLRLNVINAIPDHDCTTRPDSSLDLGYGAVVTGEHRLDFTDGVSIGRCSVLAGRNSSLWTHNRRDSAPVRIGDYCYIGSETRMAPGATIPDCCIVGLGSVVTEAFTEAYSLIAGVPAARRRAIEERDHPIIFGPPRPDMPDGWLQPPARPGGR